jgi:hypothetical protein
MLLALLALALPTAALANSFAPEILQSSRLISGTYVSGLFQSGTISGSITNGGSFDVSVVGDSKITPIFSFDIGPLTQVFGILNCVGFPENMCFKFDTGTIIIKNTAGATLFTNSLTDGMLFITPPNAFNGFCAPNTCASLSANLLPNSMVIGGFTIFNFTFMGSNLNSGEALVTITLEPSALEGLLIGTGLLGLAEMARRKLVPGT